MIDVAKVMANAFDTIKKAVRAFVVKPEPVKLAYPAEWFDWMHENPRQNATISPQRTRASKLDYRKAKNQRRNLGHWGPRK